MARSAAQSRGQPFPERIGRFELLIPIGTGGMGSVYLARMQVVEGVHRDVAVKVIHPTLRAEGHVAEELLHEASLAARIRHPNVVTVLEAGNEPEAVFLAMEYVEGDTLSSLVRSSIKAKAPIPLGIAGRILCDALTGLHAAHELRGDDGESLHLVHRDFSPQNILVGVDGVSRLTDFGIAKSISQVGATATGIIKGKVNYMAPEQALGKHVDRRCDVWAAGVVAWETFAGRRLFKESNDAAVLLRIVSNDKPPRLSSQRGDVSAELDAVISNALLADLDARVPDAETLRQRMIAALAVEGGLADHEEVARYVSEVAADKLAERRAKVAEVLELREQLHEVSRAAEQMARREVESINSHVGPAKVVDEPTAVMDEPTEDMRTHIRSLQSAKRGPNRTLILGALGVAALGIGWFSVALLRGGEETVPTPTDVAATATPVEVTSAAPSALPDAVPSATTADAALEISANEPIAQLRIGSRNIVLGEPVTKLEVLLKDDERDVALTLTAITRDGRNVEHELKPGERSAALSFVGRAPRPVRRGKKRPPPKPEPGLADSPYKK